MTDDLACRIASTLRDLADELERPIVEEPKRRRPRVRHPSGAPVNEVARAKAKKILRRKGITLE